MVTKNMSPEKVEEGVRKWLLSTGQIKAYYESVFVDEYVVYVDSFWNTAEKSGYGFGFWPTGFFILRKAGNTFEPYYFTDIDDINTVRWLYKGELVKLLYALGADEDFVRIFNKKFKGKLKGAIKKHAIANDMQPYEAITSYWKEKATKLGHCN